MKSTKIKLCSALLSATIVTSMLSIVPANALDSKANAPETPTSFQAVEDENGLHYYGPTGNNLTNKDENLKDVDFIESVGEYNKLVAPTSNLIKNSGKLPKSVDNSTNEYFPEIGDQGNLGSCLFWAQIYYQYTYELNRSLGIETVYETTFSPQWSYNVATAGIDSQCTTPTALNFMKYQGSVPLTQVPYDDSDCNNAYPTEEIWRNSINHRIEEYQFFEELGFDDKIITSPTDTDLNPIKAALNNGEILSYSTMMYGWTHTELKANSNAPANDDYVGEVAVKAMDSFEGGHRMTLVGYNDDIWVDINDNDRVDSGEMGAFKIANSWGLEYGNEGFAWVAYDALNDTSCVDGVPENKAREPIFTEVTRIEILPPGEKADIYLKYTLNTADRTHSVVSVTAEKDGTVHKAHAQSNMQYGLPMAYDGSNEATDATMILSLESVFPELTPENFTDYTWTVNFADDMNDQYPLIVKDAVIVNEATYEVYEMKDAFPRKINGDKKEIVYYESELNHAVVYYRGFYAPSISYKLDESDTQWQEAIAIEENFEKYGYTHKYVIDLGTSNSAQLYFTDESGAVDNNNGEYFTATRGINTYVTENMGKPLSVDMEYEGETVVDVGRFVLFTTESKGGYEPYLYQFIVYNLTTGEMMVDDYDTPQNKGVYFSEAGDYKITVNLKDCAGTVASDYCYITVAPIPFEFTTFEAISQNNTYINDHPITFKAVTNYENIGIYYQVFNEYKLTIRRGQEICYTTVIPMEFDSTNSEYMTSTITTKWTPKDTGFYSAIISATDCAGEYAEKTINFMVDDCIVGDANGNGKIAVDDSTFVQRHLASLQDYDCMRIRTSDVDKDEMVSIKDATYIQMYLADFTSTKYVGEILYPQQTYLTQLYE